MLVSSFRLYEFAHVYSISHTKSASKKVFPIRLVKIATIVPRSSPRIYKKGKSQFRLPASPLVSVRPLLCMLWGVRLVLMGACLPAPAEVRPSSPQALGSAASVGRPTGCSSPNVPAVLPGLLALARLVDQFSASAIRFHFS